MHQGLLPSWGSCLIYVFLVLGILFLVLRYCRVIHRIRFALAPVLSRQGQQQRNSGRWSDDENAANEHPSQMQSVGLASAVIHSLPAIQFREDIAKGCDQGNTDCAVCLGEFLEGEWLRLLPNCAHIFHVACIDTWFLSHSTCPLCRMDVLHDFSSRSSSVSIVALLETLRREDTCSERPLGHRLLDAVSMQNPEFRLRSRILETDSDESPAFSPAIGGQNNRITSENLLQELQPYKGESSRADRTMQATAVSPEIPAIIT